MEGSKPNPLKEGDTVAFQLKSFEGNLQAHYIAAAAEQRGAEGRDQKNRQPRSTKIFDWAYLGYLTHVLSELQGLALPERWGFKDTPANPERPFPILYSYVVYTFGRLVLEKKVMVNETGGFAAFNTGLVDARCETIYALFVPNEDPRAQSQLNAFLCRWRRLGRAEPCSAFQLIAPQVWQEPHRLIVDA